MAGSGKRWNICLLAVLLASACAEDQLNNDSETQETKQSEASRSGMYYASEEDSYLEHLESNKQQHSNSYAGPGGSGNSYSFSEQQKAYESSQHHASQYGQDNQQRYYVPPVPQYGPGPSPYVSNLVPGYNYQQANEESLKQHYQYNHNQAGNAVDNIIVRPISYNEYYWLHRQPGYENTISCQREGELHSYWTPSSDCMICVCTREFNYLEPACISCRLCSNPVPIPIHTTSGHILPVHIETTTELLPQPLPPQPVPEIVTCSPMPSGVPFQNPLNPCQVCMCYESVNIFGVPDVKIECEENPQCVLPPEPIPYIPDIPLPLPQCEQFPNNVLFPHPVEACKVCKCTVEYTPYGPQDQIICFPDSDCIAPVPLITPAPVTLYPIPSEPIIIPVTESVRPIVTPRPNPGPLPGPSPHESCRPYVPNQPFQHPWDECQMCVCSEDYNIGQITIEINCYTKATCCIEIPFDQTTAPLHYIPSQPGQIQVVATPVYPYHVPGYVPGGAQPWSTEITLQEQEQPNYAYHKQNQQYGVQVPVQYPYVQPGYNKLISPKPSYSYIPGLNKQYYNHGQSPYLPVNYGQGTYGQSTTFDESEHYDKNLSYDQKVHSQSANGQSVIYAPGISGQGGNYAQTAYGQSTAFDESEHYDKNLSYDQKAYAQSVNGQGVLYSPKTYGQGGNYAQTAYGQSTAFDESEHYDKNLSYDQKAYAQSVNGQGVLYSPKTYGQGGNYAQTAYGQSTAFDESEHYDKNLSYDQKAYAQSVNGQGVLYSPKPYGQGGNYAQTAYGQSTAFDESEHYDKNLSYDQKAYAQSVNGQGVLYSPKPYGQGGNYAQTAYGQSTAFDESEHYDKNLAYAQKAYNLGQGLNYGVYGQSPANGQILGLGLGPVKLSVKARTKSALHDIYKTGATFSTREHGITTRHPAFHSDSDSVDRHKPKHVRELPNLAHFGDAQHRGPNWYDYRTSSEDSAENQEFDDFSSTSASTTSTSDASSGSAEASSFETKEEVKATRVYRTCTPCPHDMLKRYKNMGIKWICAGYQRARRTFKSECMMRYRNCQDGTLFVKLHDHKCDKDPYHGRHFFYHYRT